MNKNKKILIPVIIVVILAIIGGGYWAYRVHEINDQYLNVVNSSPQSMVNTNMSTSQKENAINKATSATAISQSAIDKQMIKSYEEAKAESSSVIGWIYIPGTDINYPINHHTGTDLSYYLHHNWKNQPWWNGAIFLSNVNTGINNKWALINGHNMLNGIMFAQLLKYENKAHAEKYPDIYIYQGSGLKATEYKVLGARIVNQNTFSMKIGDLSQDTINSQLNKLLNGDSYTINKYNGNNVLVLNTCLSNGTPNHMILITEKVN